MKARILPFAEWGKLEQTDIPASVWAVHDKASLQIVVVEDDGGAVIGTWATLACRHVECFWLREDVRKNAAAMRALFEGMRDLLGALRASTVVTVAETPEVAALLESAGATKVPGTMYLLPVDFGPWAKG